MKKVANVKFRFNLITSLIYLLGILLLLQLFNLQIVHGQEYRDKSNTRLTREGILEATRGSLLDNNGTTLVSDSLGFRIEFYKSKADTDTLNSTILNIVNVLQSNGDLYADSFPIDIDPFVFNLSSDEKVSKWKKDNKIDEDTTAEECFYKIKDKYKIKTDNIQDARKIMAIRYEIIQKGYSSTKAVTISSSVSLQSALVFNERSSDFPGISVVVQPVRNYKSASLASHIIGNIGQIDNDEMKTRKDTYNANDIIGKTGVEYVFEEYLKGKNGTKQIDMSVDGTVTEEYITKEAVKGSDIILTIDANLQKITEETLKNNIQKIREGGFAKKYDTNAGAAVVMNVNTGEILAMASYPDFNPQDFVGGVSTSKWNEYISNPYKPLRNKAVQDAYAPGSIFKMVTGIAALESEVIGLNDKINDTGIYPKYDKKKCWFYTDYHRGHGWLNMSGAIKNSCNFFFYEVADRMGVDKIEQYARYFGLGNKTGIELPSETSGIVASKSAKAAQDKQQWYPGETLSAAIGQSFNQFSPLQIAKYISMISNNGKKINPTVIKSIINSDGNEVSKEEINKFVNEKLGLQPNNTEELSIKKENINAILEGMRSVTSDNGGTAFNIFKNFNIEVGGKTGSAEVGEDKVNAWFTGFAPFENPEIAVVVFVENGGHGNYSAEAARDIMAQYFGMNTNKVQEDMTAVPYTETFR